METHTHNDKVLIHYFQDSLTRVGLNWYVRLEQGPIKACRDLAEAFLKEYKYNENMAPDCSQLQGTVKKEYEGFKEYVQRWHELAAQVQPPITEKEMVTMFINALPSPYYDRVVGNAASSFVDLVVVGERIELGVRHEKLSQTNSNEAMNQCKSCWLQPNFVGHEKTAHDVDPDRHHDLYRVAFPIIGTKLCDYHNGAIGHTTEKCRSLKHKVQDLLDGDQLRFRDQGLNAQRNPFPAHKGVQHSKP
ncbi:hypothetical protein CR513_13096, partial [Mucuna pruriens]